MGKAQFGELLLATSAVTFAKSHETGKRARLNRMGKMSVFEELHQSGFPHFHFPCAAEDPWTYGPLKAALRAKGICVEFSEEHDYYWTTFMYLSVPSALPGGKTEKDLDLDPWLSPGHPTTKETLEDIPRGARPCDKARARRYLGLKDAGKCTSKDMAYTDKEFSALVVARNFRDVTAVMAWAQECTTRRDKCSQDELLQAVGVEAYMYKNQRDLAEKFAFAWQMHSAPAKVLAARTTAWEMLVAAAAAAPCECHGRWVGLTEELLLIQCENFPATVPANEVPYSSELRAAITESLQKGAAKFTNVFLYGPTTSGKSHVLKPLLKIFKGFVFIRPAGRGNFPLQDIFDKKLCVFQDVRVNTF